MLRYLSLFSLTLKDRYVREKEFLKKYIPNYEELSEEEIKRLYHHMLKDHAEEVAR